MMIDGANREFQFGLTRASNFKFIDDYKFYLGVSENLFNWLTPIEEMTTVFFSNIS
mgnify:FL=1